MQIPQRFVLLAAIYARQEQMTRPFMRHIRAKNIQCTLTSVAADILHSIELDYSSRDSCYRVQGILPKVRNVCSGSVLHLAHIYIDSLLSIFPGQPEQLQEA